MSLYEYYYWYLIRPELLTKFGYSNSHQILSVKKTTLYLHFSNLDEMDPKVMLGVFILEMLSGQRSLAKTFLFKFKIHDGVISFYFKIDLIGSSLVKFLSMFIVSIELNLIEQPKSIFTKKRVNSIKNVNAVRARICFKNINLFFNVNHVLQLDEDFQWESYLNMDLLFNNKQNIKYIKYFLKRII